MDELGSKSNKELKQILKDKGISSDDCFEREDLLKKVLANKDTKKPFNPQTQKVKYGSLNCIKVSTGDKPDYVVIVLHGYGANAQDLAPIGPQILQSFALKKKAENKTVWFIHPDAILTLAAHSYAWWPLDMNKILVDVMQGNWKSVFHDEPEGLVAARQAVIKLYEELKKETGLPRSSFIFAGFSQGSMLSVDLLLHTQKGEKELPKALVVWSGAFLAQELWTKRASELDLKGLKVLQSHGRSDPILPLQTGQLLRKFLEDQGVDLKWTQFEGGHNLALEPFQDLLDQIL